MVMWLLCLYGYMVFRVIMIIANQKVDWKN
jgi:hypothetical protein